MSIAGEPPLVGAHAGRGWLDRVFALRDRLLSSQRFQRWAASFPLTRPIAERRARALFDLCAGFVYSQILQACVRLRLFEILRGGPLAAADLAARTGLSLDAMDRLLAAAVSLRLVDKRRGNRFGLGPHGAALLGNPGVGAMVEHHALLYDDLRDPVALLRGTQPSTGLSAYWPYAGAERPNDLAVERVADYSRLMAASQPMIAGDILDAYPFARHRHLLDVGGGEGAFLLAATERFKSLAVTLFDLPAVADRARMRFADAGRADRAQAVGGDFRRDSLPRGADIISLVRVVHDHDDETVMTLLRAAHDALPAGGVLLIAEPMSGTPGALPIGDAYFGFYLLAMGRGQPRHPGVLQAMLKQAGFASTRIVSTRRPMLVGAVCATK